MNQIEVFKNNEFGEIRTVIVNGEPMFCLGDICKACRYWQWSVIGSLQRYTSVEWMHWEGKRVMRIEIRLCAVRCIRTYIEN